MEIGSRYGPGLPKTPDPDQNLTGLFQGFLAAVSRIIAITAPFTLKGIFARFKTGLYKPVSIEDIPANRPVIQVWKRTPVLTLRSRGCPRRTPAGMGCPAHEFTFTLLNTTHSYTIIS